MDGDQHVTKSDKERLASIETELRHLKDSIQEVYRYLREEFAKNVSDQIHDLRNRIKEAGEDADAKATKEEVEALSKRIDDIEPRVRQIERNIWKAVGAIAIVGVITPYILKWLKL